MSYQSRIDGRIYTGPGSELVRAREQGGRTPHYRSEEVLRKLIVAAVVDGRDTDRRALEAEIIRARAARAASPVRDDGPPPGADPRDYAATRFASEDRREPDHWGGGTRGTR
jgi:hypothetical protein